MPIIDYDDEFTWTAGPPATSKQSVVGTAGTAIVGGKPKNGGVARDWGAGEIMVPYLRVVDAVAGATGGLQVDIVGADNLALTTNPVVLLTQTVPLASLTANALIRMPALPAGTKKQFLGVKLTPLTANSTTGTVIVGLLPPDARPQNAVNNL